LKSTATTTPAAGSDSTATADAAGEETLLSALGATTDSASTDPLANQFAEQNPLFQILQPSTGMTPDGQMVLASGPVVGVANLRDTARVNRYLNDPLVQQIIPSNVKLMWGVKPDPRTPEFLHLYAIKPVGQE